MKLRERLAFGILIAIMIFLFAFVFAVLGKGEYKPGGNSAQPVFAQVLPAQAVAPGVRSTATS